jgi:hypothetical protein
MELDMRVVLEKIGKMGCRDRLYGYMRIGNIEEDL